MHNSDTQENSTHRFNVETLKWEKTTGEKSFTIHWIYNGEDYNTHTLSGVYHSRRALGVCYYKT